MQTQNFKGNVCAKFSRILVNELKDIYHCFTVQRGVDRVTAISNHEVEAPDYDSEGHMEPTIHREDMQEDDED